MPQPIRPPGQNAAGRRFRRRGLPSALRLDAPSSAGLQQLDGDPRRWQLETDGRWRGRGSSEAPGASSDPASSSRALPTEEAH
eukprot:5717382-Alexandrium_andersonii.AAC.1